MSGEHGVLAQTDAPPELTEREQQVLELLWRGYGNSLIAAAMGMSPKTIDLHRQDLLKKFRVANSVSLVRAALRQGLLEV